MQVCLTVHCDQPWFSFLANGIKPVEGRKGKKKYRDLKPGDVLCFQSTSSEESFFATVVKIDDFNTILEYLEAVTLEKALPGVSTLKEGLAIYSQWNTTDEINTLGFLAIWIKVMT